MERLIVLTLAYSSDEEQLKLTKTGLQAAANTFQHSLLKGLRSEFCGEIVILNCLPVGSWPKYYRKAMLQNKEYQIEGCHCYEIGGINIPFLKQISRGHSIRNKIKKILQSDDKILIYSTYMPFLWAIKNNYDCHATIIVTDLPENYDLQKRYGLQNVLRRIQNRIVYKCIATIERYVLLTDKMRYPLNIESKPYIVVEGICDSSDRMLPKIKFDKEKEILFYSGTLNYRFGIMDLVDSVRRINSGVTECELWICGDGEAAEEIADISDKNSHVRFFGFCTKEKLLELRSKATLLINPRKNDSDYTKYSFPSKTMEYMASGIPVIMYRLDGIPKEYNSYLYYIDDKEQDALTKKIIDIVSLPLDERKQFGLRARKFVLEQKNETIQSKKILDFIFDGSNNRNETR